MDDTRQATVTAQAGARRPALASPASAAVLGLVVLLQWIAAAVLLAVDHRLTAALIGGGAGLLVYACAGVVVALHQPRNAVGWILIFFTFFFLLGIDGQYFAVFCYRLGHSGLAFGRWRCWSRRRTSWPSCCFRWPSCCFRTAG